MRPRCQVLRSDVRPPWKGRCRRNLQHAPPHKDYLGVEWTDEAEAKRSLDRQLAGLAAMHAAWSKAFGGGR